MVPLLLLLLFGIITFGFLFAQDLALGNSSRQSARYGVVQGHSCASVIAEAKDSSEPLVTLVDSDVIVLRGKTPSTATPVCGDPSVEPCKDSEIDDNLYVRVDYTASVLLPLPGMGSTVDLDGEGVFRCEFS